MGRAVRDVCNGTQCVLGSVVCRVRVIEPDTTNLTKELMSLIIHPDGASPLPEYKFYDGTETLRFDESKWKYFRVLPNGKLELLAGVTTVCHIIDKSEVLMRWAVKKAMEKMRRLLSPYVANAPDELPPILFATILDELIAEAKKADREELEAAAETGHIAHAWIENYVKAILSDNEERRHELLAKLPLDERAANCCVAALEWMSAHDVRWRATERKVFSRRHGYAGTMDGLAVVSSCSSRTCCPVVFQDRLSIVDWKTSNYLYIEYLLQTAAYQQAHQEETGEVVTDCWINRLGKDDAEFDPWHRSKESDYIEDLTAYLQALGLYRSVHNIQDRMDEIKDAKLQVIREKLEAIKAEQMKIRCPKADKYKGTKISKCLEDGTQCVACKSIYEEKQNAKTVTKI
jgi:hypothetical protein